MSGWWGLEILRGMFGSLSDLSKEEWNAVTTIMLIGVAIFCALMLFGEVIFRHLNIRDDLDIHVGVLFSFSVLVAFPLARILFAWVRPAPWAAAVKHAEKRYADRQEP